MDQLALQRQANVTGLELLDDLVLVTGVVQLHLVLEIEGGFGVVAGVDLQLLADVARQVELYALVEIEGGNAPLVNGYARVLGLADVDPEGDLGAALWLDLDLVTPEDPVEGLALHVDLRDQGLVVAAGLLIEPFQPVRFHGLLHVVLHVLFERHAHGRAVVDVALAHGALQDVLAGKWVEDHLLVHVGRIAQVDAAAAFAPGCYGVGDRIGQLDLGTIYLL